MGETGEFSVKAYADAIKLKDWSQSGATSTLKEYKLGMRGERIWPQQARHWSVRLGGTLEQDRVDHSLTGEHYRENISINSQVDRNFGDITASLGGRADFASDFGFFPTLCAGLTYSIGPHTQLKTNVGYTVNIPTFSQLYQSAHGSMDQVRGNSDLDEEKVYTYDFGLEHKFDNDRVLQVTLFRSDFRDFITYLRGADLIYRPENVARAYRQGIEVTFRYKMLNAVDLDLSYICQQSKNREMGGELPYTPHHKFKITGKTVLETATRVEISLSVASRQFSDPENSDTGKLHGYGSMDLMIIQPVTIKTIASELFVQVQNLLDNDFEIHQGYPDDGFRFMAGLNLKF